MREKHVSWDEQIKHIMEYCGSGLPDYQWCQTNDIISETFYMWISRLKKAGYTRS